MSTEQSYEPELVDQTRQQIRGLVREIEDLVRAEVPPEEFYEGFLHRVVAALAAIGGAVWTLDEEGRLTLNSHINLGETRLHESPEDQQRHGKLLRKVLAEGQGAIVQPHHSGAPEDGTNPTEFLLVLGILKSDQEIRGLVEVFQRSGGRPAVERGYLRFVMQMCELAEDYLKTRQLRLYTDRQAIWTQLEQFTRQAHGSLDPRATAYTLANEGRRLIDCDRVSLAIRKGRHCRIEAVSGQETFDKRSNTVTLLGELASVVVKAGEPLWYTGDTRDLAPQVEEAVEAYVDESHSKAVVVLPLARPHDLDDAVRRPDQKPEYLGALIIEQINTDGIPTAMRRRVDVVAEHGSVALANAVEHNSLFLMPLWRTLGKSKWIISARTLPKTITVAVILLGGLLSLFLVPADFQLHGKGTLEPLEKRDIFAQVDGQILNVFVKHGDNVKAGDKVAEMRNTELDGQIADILGKLSANTERMLALQRAKPELITAEERYRNAGESAIAREEERSLKRQLELLEDKKQKLILISPIDGRVTTWRVEEQLPVHRPIKVGDKLLTIADPTKDWELEVFMPEDRMGHIKRAQRELGKNDLEVDYIMASDPGRTLYGTVHEVGEKAELQGEDGNTVKVRVAISKADLRPETRPGAGVSAKIDCGRRSLGYVWFHDIIEFVQSKILFRW